MPAHLWIDEGGAIVLESEEQDAFAVCICSGQKLRCVFETGQVQNYQHTEAALTYEQTLPGSIERRRQYRYDLRNTEKAPAAEGTDWQQEAYPMPDTAEAAVVRYMEAVNYQLPEELEVLTERDTKQSDGFSVNLPVGFRKPDQLSQIKTAVYDAAKDRKLLEVSYPAEETEVRFYAEAIYRDGWRISGFSDTFIPGTDADGGDASISILPLNGEINAKLQDKDTKDVYRVLLAAPSRIQMVWRAGEKQGSTEAFQVSLYSGTVSGDPVMSYRLKLSAGKQMSMPLFVTAGLYYVTVEPLTYLNIPYRLSLQAIQDLHAETEHNDTADSADEIELNQAYSGSLSDKKDVDCFRFVLEKPGEVHIRMTASGEGSRQSCYRVRLVSESDGKILTVSEMTGNSGEMDSGAVYAAAGAYVICIEKGTVWLGMEYQVTAEYTSLEGVEQENDDTPETATAVSVNEDIRGSVGTEEDVDCFRFTLEQDAIVQVKLNIDPIEQAGKAHIVSILKGTEPLMKASIGGKEASSRLQSLVLAAGTYTLRLENVKFARQDYSFRIICEEIGMAEGEPNDTQTQATKLVIGSELTGVLSSAEDLDWYKLSLTKEQVLTFTMSFPQGSGKDKPFCLQMEQNGKTLWSKKLEEGSGGTVEKLQIPAGEYYFCVKTENWNGAVYTICFQ